jgi:hypothetical protein
MATKMIPKNILHTEGLGREILGKLAKFSELPKTGFIAGGAVANTILSMEWGGDYPVNDLDIFRIESTDEPDGALLSRKMPHRCLGMNVVCSLDLGMIMIDLYQRYYTVSNTEVKGMLNFIGVQLKNSPKRMDDYRLIMEGFDLNCCQVGIDLESAELIYTPNFEAFLKTMQLQVSHPCTPFHTAIRIPKKKKELQCYCNYETQYRYLSQIPLILSPQNQGNGARKQIPSRKYAMYFGEKCYRIYEQYREDLDRYFEVIPAGQTASGGLRYTMVPRNSEIIEELKDCHSVAFIKRMWEMLQHKKSVRDKNIRTWKLDGFFSRRFLMANPNYAQCDWHEKHLQQIEEFLDQHRYMAVVFDYLKLNIQKQVRAMRTIKRMADKEGLYVIGLIESAIWDYRRGDPSKLPPDNAITEGWIKSLIDNYLENNSGLLKEPEDLTDFECGQYFSELITAKDLMSEGARMHHCVGGYAESVKRGESAIFHIEAAGEPSTIEISKDTTNGTANHLFIRQHKGIWNKEPSPFHKRRARDLVNYLNMTQY